MRVFLHYRLLLITIVLWVVPGATHAQIYSLEASIGAGKSISPYYDLFYGPARTVYAWQFTSQLILNITPKDHPNLHCTVGIGRQQLSTGIDISGNPLFPQDKGPKPFIINNDLYQVGLGANYVLYRGERLEVEAGVAFDLLYSNAAEQGILFDTIEIEGLGYPADWLPRHETITYQKFGFAVEPKVLLSTQLGTNLAGILVARYWIGMQNMQQTIYNGLYGVLSDYPDGANNSFGRTWSKGDGFALELGLRYKITRSNRLGHSRK